MTSTSASDRRFEKVLPILRTLRFVFYFAVLFLWFKDNFAVFRKFRLSVWLALVPLAAVVLAEILLRFRKRSLSWKPEYGKTALALLAIALLTVAFRLPFLLSSPGLMWSDEGIPALMAKHIAQGNVPPICHYQQHYLGSLGSHIYALAFSLFGYSIPLLKAVTLLMYLVFVALQFFFFKDILSLTWATVLAFFYSLPIGQLIDVSTSNSNPYSLVLLLGSAILLTAYTIAHKKRAGLWPLLGFLMGLSFWTHQITAAFILAAFLVAAVKTKPRLKTYGVLCLYAVAGVFPLLLQEVFDRFQLFQFVFGGEKSLWQGGKFQATLKLLQSLLFAGDHAAGPYFLIFLLAGVGALVFLSLKIKKYAPLGSLLLFLLIFCGMYAASRFSDKLAVRYLFPLYVCLPVILAAPFIWMRARVKYVLFAGLLVVLVFLKNGQAQYNYYLSVKDSARYFEQVIAAMKATGNLYWRGSYETSYVLTAVAAEQVIVDSFGVNKYWPHRLLYDNGGQRDSYVFLNAPWTSEPAQSKNLDELLRKLGIPFQGKAVGECRLFYDIESPVFPRVLVEPVPSFIPQLEIERTEGHAGSLDVIFKNLEIREPAKFRVNVKIPGYSVASKTFSGSSDRVTCTIPAPAGNFALQYYLDYQALRIPSSAREIQYGSAEEVKEESGEPIVFLEGAGPKIRLSGREVRLCEKDVRLKVRTPKEKKATVRLDLYSPFDFSNLYWYGDYAQQVRIILGPGRVIERTLHDGSNVVTFEIEGPNEQKPWSIVELRFRYHLLFDFANLRKTAALLEDARISTGS